MDKITNDGWGKLETDMKSNVQAPVDPGINATDLAYDRMRQLVSNVSSETLKELTAFRDQIDNLMIAIRRRDEQLINDITNHTDFCSKAITAKKIIADAIQSIHADFNKPVVTLNKEDS